MENNKQETKFPELVAYLDGELVPAEKLAVETRLAADKEYREELAQLQKSWDLLDLLPSVEATESFTQSTVEMVALSAATQIQSLGRWYRFRKLLISLILVFLPLVAFGFGYWRSQSQLNAENEATAQDLVIIQRFPIYRSVNADLFPEKSIQFLELLAQADLADDFFISFDVKQSESLKKESFDFPLQVADLNAETLGVVKLEKLAESKKSFDNLESQQDQLRKFHRLLSEHPDRDRLVEALSKYHTWFRSRIFLSSQDEIDRIMDASPEARVELIRQLELDYFRSSFKYIQQGRRIPAIQDYKKIKAFGREILGEIRDEFIQMLATSSIEDDPAMKEIVDALKEAPTDHHFFALMIRYSSQLYGNEFINPFFDPVRIRPFIKELSVQSQNILQGLDARTKIIVVQLWVFSSLGNIDNSELAQFENKILDGKQRSSLNQLNNYQKKREILTKAFFYTLEPFRFTPEERRLPEDLMELADWNPLPDRQSEAVPKNGN